jgi:hypothetical protein
MTGMGAPDLWQHTIQRLNGLRHGRAGNDKRRQQGQKE